MPNLRTPTRLLYVLPQQHLVMNCKFYIYHIDFYINNTIDQVFYWSIHENEVIKTFDSSESEFIDINLNPNDDTFLAINSAGILQVWDLSAVDMEPLAIFNIREDQKLDDKFNINLAANFDTTGVVLAIAIFIEETSDVENKVIHTKLGMLINLRSHQHPIE